MNDRLLRACRMEKTDSIPIWLMRQVGRYLPEYRAIRRKQSFLEICKNPEIAAELTVIPVEKFNLDGAIIFSDILIPLESCGFNLRIDENNREVILDRLESIKDIEKLKSYNPELTSFVYESIKLAKRMLNDKVPIIGFAGGPFTLSCYLIEGRNSRTLTVVKQFMYQRTDLWEMLMENLTRITVEHIIEQIKAGASIIQIFDSWAGELSPSDYRAYVLPYTREAIREIGKLGAPVIHFSTCCAGILDLMREAGGDVIAIDWRMDIGEAWERLGYEVAIQGNLDPATLLAGKEVIASRVKEILDKVANRPGYIFNLGHGIHPSTPCENVEYLVEYVHGYQVSNRGLR